MEPLPEANRPRYMMVCFHDSTKEIITRAFVHSMDELLGLLVEYHRYYWLQGKITQPWDEWKLDIAFDREENWNPVSWWRKWFCCCAREKIKIY